MFKRKSKTKSTNKTNFCTAFFVIGQYLDKMALKTEYSLSKASDQRSNESSTSKFFQRTMSAQNTLLEATALLDSEKVARNCQQI